MHLFADGVLSTVTLYLIQLVQFGTAFLETCYSACVTKGYSSKYFAGNLNRQLNQIFMVFYYRINK